MTLLQKLDLVIADLTPTLERDGGVKSSDLYTSGKKHNVKCREICEAFVNPQNRLSKGLYGLTVVSATETPDTPQKTVKRKAEPTEPPEPRPTSTITPGLDNPLFVWIAEPDLEPEPDLEN